MKLKYVIFFKLKKKHKMKNLTITSLILKIGNMTKLMMNSFVRTIKD